MTPEQVAALREPFPPEQVGKLPKAGTQLDYVGHAAVTDRLIQVDPEWTWEPMAYADDGGPLVRTVGSDLELWVRLTVCGVTRPGVGTVSSAVGDSGKQLVSDALRNAAMRFGVALDLWSKEDLSAHEPTVDEADAETFREALNAGDAAARKAWLAHFGVTPDRLPVSRRDEAIDWLADRCL